MRTLLITLLLCGRAFCATYYVDATGGSNAANGTSSGTAWQTLAFAQAQTYSTGDTLLLKRGETWNEEFTMQVNGMIIDAYGTGAKPIIDGQGVRKNLILMGVANDTYTRNVHLKNAGHATETTGASWSGGTGTNTLEDSTVEIHQDDACVAGGTGHIIVSRCLISGANDDGITLHAGSALIENCTITLCSQGINNSLNSGPTMVMTVNDCVFIDNINSDIGPPDDCTSIFNRCQFKRTAHSGCKFADGNAGATTYNYCTFDATKSTSSAAPEFSTGPVATLIQNCTFVGNSAVITGKMSNVATLTNCIFQNWWKIDGTSGSVNANYNIFYNVSFKTAFASNTNDITTDPLFVDAAAGNYRLQAGSPAINAGTNLGLTTDLAGRAVGNPPEIGAYEYYAGGNVTAGNLSVGTLSIGP